MAEKKSTTGLLKNKLWLTLCCFSREEHIRIRRYLKSPYFISSKSMPALHQSLLECIERNQDGFDRFAVWKEVFPDEPYDDVNFRKVCSDLLRIIGQFMAAETHAENEAAMAIGTLSYAIKNKIEPYLTTAMKLARARVDPGEYKSVDDFFNEYYIERQNFALMEYVVKLNSQPNLEEISNNLDLFYWIEKLKLFSSLLSQQRRYTRSYDLKFMGPILDFLREYPVDAVPELAIHYYSFLTLYEPENVEHYNKLRQLLDLYATKMPQKAAIEMFDSVLVYCTGKINQGDRTFLQEYFNVFEEALQKGIFLQDNELADWRFNNLVASALGLGKIDWAENFVHQYKDYLPADTRENTYAFNLARVYRFQKQYDRVLELLQNIEYEDIGINLISKMMLLITHYERKDTEVLSSFIESFRVFLNRHKNIPPQRRLNYLNLLKYTRKLMRLNVRDKKAVAALREEIIREKANLVNQEWLLEKLEER